MRKIKLLSVLVVFCLIFVFTAEFSSASAAATVTDPKETVLKAIRNMRNLESGHVDFNFVVSIPESNAATFPQGGMDILVKGEYDAQLKPILANMIMNLSMKNGTRKFEQDITCYLEEAGNEMLIYSNEHNYWTKQSFPKSIYDYYQSDEYLKAIKNVALKSQDANTMVFEVRLDMNYIKECFNRKAGIPGNANTKPMSKIQDNLEDFTYIVTIDKKTSYISKIEMDFSDYISKMYSNMAEAQGGTDEQKSRFKEMYAMYANMKATATVTFSKFNHVGEIIIPEEVKTKAKEMSLPPSRMIPPKVIKRSPAVYPAEARAKRLEGKVLLKLNISDTGTVTGAKILQSSGFDILDNAAVNSVMKWRFTPAQMNGKAIAGNHIHTINFQFLDSAEIVKIQRKLNELGYDCGEPDGIIGPKTVQAIKDFQQSRGLAPDGIVGPETKKALGI